jgi:hypothetical protein
MELFLNPEQDESSPRPPIVILKYILILSSHLRLVLSSGLFPFVPPRA